LRFSVTAGPGAFRAVQFVTTIRGGKGNLIAPSGRGRAGEPTKQRQGWAAGLPQLLAESVRWVGKYCNLFLL